MPGKYRQFGNADRTRPKPRAFVWDRYTSTLHKVFPLSHNRVTLHIMKQLSLNINIKQLRPRSRLILCLSQKAEQYFTFGFAKQERAFEGYFEKKIFPENPSLTSPSLDRVVRTSQGALTTLYRGFLLYCIYCL